MNPFYEQQKGIFRTSIVNNLSFPEHLHTHTEFIYVMEGQALLSIGKKVYQMERGGCAIIFPGQIHSYHSSNNYRMRLFIFDTGMAAFFNTNLENYARNPLILTPGMYILISCWPLTASAILMKKRLPLSAQPGYRLFSTIHSPT